jgi:hypothetical protein
MLRFTKLYDNKFISNKQNNGEFDYWFILDVIDWIDAVGEREAPAKWAVEVNVVSPSEAGPENMEKAFSSMGMDFDEEVKARPEVQAEVLSDYGIHAPVWCKSGNNLRMLMREARKQAKLSEFLFGFMLDRPVNRIGTTGWEAMRGDITAGLTRLTNES